MYLAPEDFKNIFSMEELMERVKFKGTCWIWKGSYTDKARKVPAFVFRFDGEIVSINPTQILSMLILGNVVDLKKRKCKNKNCVNPGHYALFNK